MTHHQSEVSELMDSASKWIDRWSGKEQLKEPRKENCDLSIGLRELNKLKLQQTKSLLERLEQLKEIDDIADQRKILSEVVDTASRCLWGLLLLSCSPRVEQRHQRPLLWMMLSFHLRIVLRG